MIIGVKMKPSILSFTTAILLASNILFCWPFVAVAQPTLTLRIASLAGGKFERDQVRYFINRVTKLTDGRLRFEVLAAGAVVKPFEVPNAVYKDVLEAAFYVRSRQERILYQLSTTACGLTIVDQLVPRQLLGGEIVPRSDAFQNPTQIIKKRLPIVFITQKKRWNSFTINIRSAINTACTENYKRADQFIPR